MKQTVKHDKEVLVIGGGITGLVAAYRLQQQAPDAQVALIEKSERLGGKIITERVGGFVIEGGPDCFLSRKPRGVALAEELGLAQRLHGRNPAHEKTFVKRNGRLYPLPSGLTGMVPTDLDALAKNPLISPAGQKRLAQELDLPAAPDDGDESVAGFITRRLGREAYEQLVEPLMGGIYAGDGEQLSLAATFPQLRQLELEHDSLIRGLLARQSETTAGADYPPFVTLPAGMAELVDVLVERLAHTAILTEVAATGIGRRDGRYRISLDNGQTQTADSIILTTPAFVTAELLRDLDPHLADAHAAIPYASSVTISLAYRRPDVATTNIIAPDLDGYGYVIPRVEDTDLLACTFTSSKWENRAPADHVLVRVYAGRFGRRDVTMDNDADLVALARAELAETLGLKAEPVLTRVYRWPRGMPQYNMGHLQRLETIEKQLAQYPGLYTAGAAYRGVGIPDCIRSAETAVSHLKRLETGQSPITGLRTPIL